jgi:hypothetical protein
MRSPLAYPLNRNSDMEGGGAADLQTDIMRFMAILSLCLVAIFALVQSVPLTPAVQPVVEPVDDPVVEPVGNPVAEPVDNPVAEPDGDPIVDHAEQPVENNTGVSLRFESDAALTRLVATGQIGLYAIAARRAQRMTVRNSRISFWDASTPKAFHEMEATTVPGVVVDALTRTAIDFDAVSWGVTLPGKLKTQLDALMQQHDNGSLVIDANGNILWEKS